MCRIFAESLPVPYSQKIQDPVQSEGADPDLGLFKIVHAVMRQYIFVCVRRMMIVCIGQAFADYGVHSVRNVLGAVSLCGLADVCTV